MLFVMIRKLSFLKMLLTGTAFSSKITSVPLKKSHSYYYQIQMQLLVTERTFCDFVLYPMNGPVSIERIYRDANFITDMLSDLTLFWKRVVASEIFEMRVPRDLSPFVLPSDFFNELTLPAFDILSPFVTNVCKPQSTSNTDQPLSTTKLFDIENERRISVRKRMTSDKGFTGISILHKYLNPLYGFDICILSVRVHVNKELTPLKLLGKGFYYFSVMDGSGVL